MSEKVKHTPGPWEAEAAGRHRKEIYANGVGIATVWRSGTGNQIHATARLMAAAPEMLEALNAIVSIADYSHQETALLAQLRELDEGIRDRLCPVAEDILNDCRKAIARAEGK